MSTPLPRPFSRDQRMPILHGMVIFVLVIVVLQLWLLTATMNAWLGGDDSIVWPAAAVSAACLALNVGLFRYLSRIGRTQRAADPAGGAAKRSSTDRPPRRTES